MCETIKDLEVETIVQRALVKYSDAKPRTISENCPQSIAKEYKTLIRFTGITQIRTSPYHPQSNEKFDRWHAPR